MGWFACESRSICGLLLWAGSPHIIGAADDSLYVMMKHPFEEKHFTSFIIVLMKHHFREKQLRSFIIL